jgi:release factor glutamine methyltransferase
MPRVVKCYATISTTILTSRHRLFNRLQSVCGDQHTARSEWRWLEQHTRPTTYIPTHSLAGIAHQIHLKRLRHLLYKRVVLRKPLQYILGTQPFINLELHVRPPTLIPR